jgi:hypothetical protein
LRIGSAVIAKTTVIATKGADIKETIQENLMAEMLFAQISGRTK